MIAYAKDDLIINPKNVYNYIKQKDEEEIKNMEK